MEKTEIKNLRLPDPWMAQLPKPNKNGNEIVTSWNAVPLFFNIPDAAQQPSGYRKTTKDDAKNFLFLEIPGHETLKEFMKNYWYQISDGKYSFGIACAKNDDDSLLIADIDLSTTNGEDTSINNWPKIINLHLTEHAEKVWEAGNEQITPDGDRWIPSVFLVNRNSGGAVANYSKFEIISNDVKYVVGDRHKIFYNFNIFEDDGVTLTDTAANKDYWQIIAHEFSHNFTEQGDLYGPSGAIGYWDHLGDGCTYGIMSEICSLYKFAADWLTFKEQILGPSYKKKSLTLSPYTTSHEAFLVMPDPYNTPHEFFLLEYRKSTGTEPWRPDGALTEEGLLIFHVNTMLPMNHTPWHRREAPPMDVEMANFRDKGTTLRIYFEKAGNNLYPQPDNNKFTPWSQPSSNFYGHRSSGLSITNIRLQNETLKFDLEIKGYSTHGWVFTPNDKYVSGRFSADSLTEGEEIVAWNSYRFALINEREGQFAAWYSNNNEVAGFPLDMIEEFISADFDGDGLDELYLRTSEYNAILKFRNGRFERIQQYLALWTPEAGDKEYILKVLPGNKQQIMLHRNNDLVMWQYTFGEMEGLVHCNGSIGNMQITNQLMVIPAYLRSPDYQDLILIDGNQLSVIEFNEDDLSLTERVFIADLAGIWNLSDIDKIIPVDLDGDGLQEIFIRSANCMTILRWQNNTLELVYMQSDWVNHSNGEEADRISLNADNLVLKGRFRPDREGIYHINGKWIYQLLWDSAGTQMLIHKRVEGGKTTAYDSHEDDQYIVADFHRIGQDINVAELENILDFNTDKLTDIFVANKDRALLMSPNYVLEGSDYRDEFCVIWRQEKQLPLINPGSRYRSVAAVWEDRKGRNQTFMDLQSGATFSRELFVNMIEEGLYPDYHIRVINNIKTPVSNPNRFTNDNLDRL